MGFTGDNKSENSSQSKLDLKISRTINRKKSRRRVTKRSSVSSSSITTVGHRPWTRSLTRNMENFSFCSIPLKKTDKNLGFKSSKHRNERNKANSGLPVNQVKSQESMVVLYNSNRHKFASQDEIPRDLVDIKLDSLTPPGEFISDDSLRGGLTEEDHKMIQHSLSLIEELGYNNRNISSGDISGDMKIDSFIDLYHIEGNEVNRDMFPDFQKQKD